MAKPYVVNVTCPFLLGNKMACNAVIHTGTYCDRHNILQPLFGTTIPAGDLAHEKIGS